MLVGMVANNFTSAIYCLYCTSTALMVFSLVLFILLIFDRGYSQISSLFEDREGYVEEEFEDLFVLNALSYTGYSY